MSAIEADVSILLAGAWLWEGYCLCGWYWL